jgi:hypothetical protein
MAKITLNNISTLENNTSLTKINENFQTIVDEFDNVLSLDGTTPSTMLSDLDMNSNQILNLPDATTDQEPVTYSQLQSSLTTLISLGAVSVDEVQFTGGTGDQGTLSWNTDEETLDLIQNGAVLQIGQEIHVHCKNQTGSLIKNGTPVMAVGTLGSSGRILISPMVGSSISNSKYLIGITTEDIGNGEDGKVTTFGKIRGLDTTDTSIFTGTISDGDVLYIDPVNTGKLTNTEPQDTELDMPVAFVIKASSNQGTLMVRITPINENRFVKIGETNTITANQVIEVTDNTNAALRVTQLGTGNALLVEDSSNPDSTPFVVTASGNVGINTATPGSKLSIVGLPTSASGLSTGDIWNDSGTLKIV